MDGVFLSRAITYVNSRNKGISSILNTTNRPVLIEELTLTLEPFIEKESRLITDIDKSNNNIAREKANYKKSKMVLNLTNSATSQRIDLLNKLIRTDHLNHEEKQKVLDVCTEYNDLFHLDGDKLTYTKSISHEIKTNSDTPIYTKSYRYPEIHKSEVNRQISEMIKEGIIEPSESPWSSPLWVVPKKVDASGKKKWRIVIDYRKLNDIT